MRIPKRTVRLIHIMSDRQLSEDQKEIIERGIDAGMNDDELSLLANKELSCDQIMQGYYGIMCGLSVEEVATYLKPEKSLDVMQQIRFIYFKQRGTKILPLVLNDNLTSQQIIEIRKGAELPLRYVKLYANPCFSEKQMEQIRMGFEKHIPYSIMQFICDPRLSVEQMRCLREITSFGISPEEMRELAQPDIPEESMQFYLKKLKIRYRNNEKRKHMIYNLTI